jgi:hypothetical protein
LLEVVDKLLHSRVEGSALVGREHGEVAVEPGVRG